MWMLHVPLFVTIKCQGHSTAVLVTPFFMYFRCTRTSLMSLSHSCLLAIKDKSSCLVRLVLLSSCSLAVKIVAGHSLEHLPCFGSQRSTVIGLETVSFLLLQQLPLNHRQHIWGLVHEGLLVRYICAFSSSTYKPSVAAIKLFSNAVVNVQLSNPYNTKVMQHTPQRWLSLLFLSRSLWGPVWEKNSSKERENC